MGQSDRRSLGMLAALLTPLLMGMAPIFGKLAIRSGLDAYTLAALRTCFAALLLWLVFAIFFRKYIYIFPAGLIGTIVVGAVNGLGSLFYYNGLLLLDNASLAQLLNMMYAIFAMLLTRIYGQHVSFMSIVRAGMALFAVFLLSTGQPTGNVHWLGVGLMLGSAFMYALHVVLSQRVMFEMPAPTMALYALTFMGFTVLVARLWVGGIGTPAAWSPAVSTGWWFVLGLTAVTALSRLTLFAGVRNLGGLQTILLNMAEIAITLLVAAVWLSERMTFVQWLGVLVLIISVALSRWDTDYGDLSYRPLLRPTSSFGPIFPLLRRRLRPPHSQPLPDTPKDQPGD